MKLLRVKLHGFGQFNRGLDVSFAEDRLTLVVGRNEAGKSTLLNSIFGILFGFRDLNLVRKYEPWDQHDAYAGEVELKSDEGPRFRIHRDFAKNRATIDRLTASGSERIFEGQADPRANREEDLQYFDALGKILGFKDEAIFRSTVFFGQQSLQTAVSDQIRRLISGSSSLDYKGALHELHSRFSELTTENPWKTKAKGRQRLIESTRGDLEQERARLKTGRQTLTRSLELEAEVEGLNQSLGRADADRIEAERDLDGKERLFHLLGRAEDSERRYKESLARRDNCKRYSDRLATLEEQERSRFGHLKNAPSDFDAQVRAYATDQAEMQKELDLLTAERKHLDQLRPTPNNKNGLTAGGTLAGLGAASALLIPGAQIIGAAAAVAAGLLGYNIGRQVGTGYKEERARLLERIQSLQQQVKVRRKRSDEILALMGPTLLGRDPDQIIHEFQEFKTLREEKKSVLAAIKALGSADVIEREFQEASKERGAVAASLEALLKDHPSFANMKVRADVGRLLEEARARFRALQTRATEEQRRLEACRIELATLGTHLKGNLAEMEEGVRAKEQRLDTLDLERDALKEAIDTLDECIKEFQDGDAFRLSQEISAIFSKITGEKYTRVQLGSSLEPVLSRGDEVPISPQDLSQGAQDQLYFAMRVAMARHLSRNIRLPLFLDDPFVNFDQERLQITKDVLGHLEEHQVIMVTCDRDYIPWTDAVVDLDKVKAATA
ncbi:MAG TPA: AAA family ATPase [Planctomycetota bacterium]|nr:AAA family ATPase [Planctomycetota bacterium]